MLRQSRSVCRAALDKIDVVLAPDQMGQMNWLYRNGDVVSRTDNEDGSVSISIRATASAREEIENRLRRGKE